MPTKAHRPGLVRTHSHSRTSSGNGPASKAALNLHFTQKDPAPPKADKAKRNGHDTTARPPAFARTNSSIRVQSREHLPSAAQPKRPPARAQPPAAPAPPANGKHKAGFTLSSNGSDEDEDEWISSERGAATPNVRDNSSSESEIVTTPQERRKLPPPPVLAAPFDAGHSNPAAAPRPPTPRAETMPEPQPQQKPPQQQQQQQPRANMNNINHLIAARPPSAMPPSVSAPLIDTSVSSTNRAPPGRSRTPDQTSQGPKTPTSASPPTRAVARTQPPTPTSPRPHQKAKRMSSTRPPSIISHHDGPLRPHPLIRGNSYGLGHAHLAPLAVTSSAAQAHISSSPPDNSSIHPSIPTPTSPTPSGTLTAPFRRPSTSSARSISTLPGSPQPAARARATHDRTRTLSTASTASSAALSSLAQLPTGGNAPTAGAHHLTAFFPQQNPHARPEAVHALLPSPYVMPHLTVLAWRNPVRESYDRVIRAKARRAVL
ncbi:hypothetical protein OF83DRAFT_1179044 [Amylostereum chailletii]|nr:hypothetical protein OF83DRAFT_1179044 [Amylostereum chailletii]